MLEKFPVDVSTNKQKELSERNTTNLKDLKKACENFLLFESSERDINVQSLKSIAENHRSDMKLNTSAIMQELDFVDNQGLKLLYNYRLACNRENYESVA